MAADGTPEGENTIDKGKENQPAGIADSEPSKGQDSTALEVNEDVQVGDSSGKHSNGTQASTDTPSTPTVAGGHGAEKDGMMPIIESGPQASSPTHSVSSMSSSDSTRKLIKNLSMNGTLKVDDKDSQVQHENNNLIISPVLHQSETTAPPPKTPPLESKKPIKFTVRKVSREEHRPPSNTSRLEKKSYRYGNLPENQERKSAEKMSHLKASQAKYDSYATRIDKIDKEIRFLTGLLPPYNVEIDYSTRTKIIRAIEKLEYKKDEIEKKKYGLGMSISRLWREYDENSTWVRSVSKH